MVGSLLRKDFQGLEIFYEFIPIGRNWREVAETFRREIWENPPPSTHQPINRIMCIPFVIQVGPDRRAGRNVNDKSTRI